MTLDGEPDLLLPIHIILWGEWKWMDVDAWIVDVAPHLAHVASFAIHRGPNGRWTVSNIETGRFVAAGDAPEFAVQSARTRLRDKTPADIEDRYAKSHET